MAAAEQRSLKVGDTVDGFRLLQHLGAGGMGSVFRVQDGKGRAVPIHLRDAHYQGAKSLGHGDGYAYPHDDPSGWVDQQYLPDEVADRVYYHPTTHGHEDLIRRQVDERRAAAEERKR